MENKTKPLIKLDNVSKFYTNQASVALGLQNVSLELFDNEFVVVSGESGGGKSTLLNVISGIDTYEDGEMYFNGEPTSHYDSKDWEEFRKENISFVFQNYGLIDSYTVLENVMAGMVVMGQPLKVAKQKAIEVIDMVGLTPYIKHKGTKLSGGQKQRLAIARALCKNSKVLVADEPTGNLDSKTGEEIIQLLKQISKHKLVIIVTHNVAEVKGYSTRNIRLYNSKIHENIVVENVDRGENVDIDKGVKKSNIFTKSAYFSYKTTIRQPKMTTFTFLVTLVIAVVFAVAFSIFNGSIVSEQAQQYSSVFQNTRQDRVLAIRSDNSNFHENEYEEIALLDKGNSVYKSTVMVDATVVFEYNQIRTQQMYPAPISKVNEFELYGGRLPTKVGEVLISSNHYIDEYHFSNLFKKQTIAFTTRINSSSKSITRTLEVVGVVHSLYGTTTESTPIYIYDEDLLEIENELLALTNISSIGFNLGTDYGYNSFVENIFYNVEVTEDDETFKLGIQNYADEGEAILKTVDKKTINDVHVYNLPIDSPHQYIISEGLFNALYDQTKAVVTVFVEENSEAPSFARRLDKAGYNAVAISDTLETDVVSGLAILIFQIIFGSFLIFSILMSYLLGYFTLRITINKKVTDIGILSSLGLERRAIFLMNFIQLFSFFAISSSISLILVEILVNFTKIGLSSFTPGAAFAYFGVNIVLSLLLANGLNKRLKKLSVANVLKET